MTHIFVASPMYGGNCTGYYTTSLMQMQKLFMNNNVTMTFGAMFNESLITRARNGLAHNFLKSDCTHLFFIDADIHWNPEHVLPMLAADKEIICGIYPKKEINWTSVLSAAQNGVSLDQLKHYTGSWVVNLVDYSGEVTVPINQPLEIWNGGTGFMLIKREVFEKLADVVPSYVNNVVDLGGQLQVEPIKEFFATSIEPENNVLLSEDYHFCRIARMNGIKVWAAPWVELGHVGTYIFEGRLPQNP